MKKEPCKPKECAWQRLKDMREKSALAAQLALVCDKFGMSQEQYEALPKEEQERLMKETTEKE